MKKLVLGTFLFGSLVMPWGSQAASAEAEAKFIFKNDTDADLNLKLANVNAKEFYVDGVAKKTYNVPTISKAKKSDVVTVKSINWNGKKPVFSMDAAGNEQNMGYSPGKTYEIIITKANPLSYKKDSIEQKRGPVERVPEKEPEGEKKTPEREPEKEEGPGEVGGNPSKVGGGSGEVSGDPNKVAGDFDFVDKVHAVADCIRNLANESDDAQRAVLTCKQNSNFGTECLTYLEIIGKEERPPVKETTENCLSELKDLSMCLKDIDSAIISKDLRDDCTDKIDSLNKDIESMLEEKSEE